MTQHTTSSHGHKHARVLLNGHTFDATEQDGQLLLSDGRLIAFDQRFATARQRQCIHALTQRQLSE